MSEKEILDKIEKSAAQEKIPESIEPEQIKRKLKENQKNKVKRRSGITYYGAVAAAALVLVIGAAGGIHAVTGGGTGLMTAPVGIEKAASGQKSDEGSEGKLIVIDGGFCRAYQDKTGTAGYTLVYNSYGMRIVTHEPFAGIDNAIKSNKDILSTTKVFDTSENRIRVAQTDDGQTIRNRIEGLSMLLCAYRNGVLKEQ